MLGREGLPEKFLCRQPFFFGSFCSTFLQEFCFVSLDIFKEIYNNRGIRNRLEAWLVFLSTDDPETMVKLMEEYPEFMQLYQEVYSQCQNVEEVMGMFSKELRLLDRNTVHYMIDDMQEQLNQKNKKLSETEEALAQKSELLLQLQSRVRELEQQLAEK